MSQRTKDAFINALISIVATTFFLFGTGAWASKENAAAHQLDIANLQSSFTKKLDEVVAGQRRILDAVCDGNKAPKRVCSEEKGGGP